jgi:hypothetical protein
MFGIETDRGSEALAAYPANACRCRGSKIPPALRRFL